MMGEREATSRKKGEDYSGNCSTFEQKSAARKMHQKRTQKEH
jgi:hypothetical protein